MDGKLFDSFSCNVANFTNKNEIKKITTALLQAVKYTLLE